MTSTSARCCQDATEIKQLGLFTLTSKVKKEPCFLQKLHSFVMYTDALISEILLQASKLF